MGGSISIALTRKLPSPNDRLHWAERARRVAMARHEAAVMARSERVRLGIDKATGPCELTIEVVQGKGSRMVDYDNCVAALKPILDALVDAGLLYDDSPRYLLRLSVSQRKDPKSTTPTQLHITVSDAVEQVSHSATVA